MLLPVAGLCQPITRSTVSKTAQQCPGIPADLSGGRLLPFDRRAGRELHEQPAVHFQFRAGDVFALGGALRFGQQGAELAQESLHVIQTFGHYGGVHVVLVKILVEFACRVE